MAPMTRAAFPVPAEYSGCRGASREHNRQAEDNSEGQSRVVGFVQRLDTLSAPMGSGAHRV
jgi:hypothetical protein